MMALPLHSFSTVVLESAPAVASAFNVTPSLAHITSLFIAEWKRTKIRIQPAVLVPVRESVMITLMDQSASMQPQQRTKINCFTSYLLCLSFLSSWEKPTHRPYSVGWGFPNRWLVCIFEQQGLSRVGLKKQLYVVPSLAVFFFLHWLVVLIQKPNKLKPVELYGFFRLMDFGIDGCLTIWNLQTNFWAWSPLLCW